MQEEVKEALESLGMSEKEIRVYVALLELGDSAVNKITERSELLRVTVYPVLKRLIEKGFVSRYSMERKSFFKAISPEQIIDKIKEKEDKINLALPFLKKIRNKINEATSVELFKGAKGISSLFERLYSGEDKELWAYGNGELIDEIIKYQSLSARKIRMNKKIKLNILANPIKRDYLKSPKYKELTRIKFNEKLKKMDIYIIFGHSLVGIINLKKEINAVLIKNEDIVQYHKFIFDSFS
ncbi:MAG: TrmB family transcriptional regulator [Nanoarchaeota archaeon]